MKRRFSYHLIGLFFLTFHALPSKAMEAHETIAFPSEDDLSITADFYPSTSGEAAPIIVLFHQAGWSRGEYREIAPRLQEMGFQALAVDQRSGSAVNGVTNLTAQRAKADGLGTTFTDALPDMRAALRHARSLSTGPLLGWGSSYSSALILKVTADDPELADGVLSFSPGEYFPDRQLIQKAVVNITVPTFITSARSEANNYAPIVSNMPADTPVTTFRPPTAGRHGSSTLWESTSDNETTWPEVEAFLAPFLALSPTGTEISLTSGGLRVSPGSSPQLVERSDDLLSWQALAVISDAPLSTPILPSSTRQAFFRLSEQTEAITADIVSVTATGTSVSVGISSPETGCEQYADWWEILDEEGNLLYRRILAHSHVNEQPFVRSGSIALAADQTVWIRAHMNSHGYGGQAFRGSIEEGFQATELSPLFAMEAAKEAPLPNGCAF